MSEERKTITREQAEFMWHQTAHDSLQLDLKLIIFYGKCIFIMTSALLGGFITYVIGRAFQ